MHRWAKRFWHGHALAGCESAALAPCDSRVANRHGRLADGRPPIQNGPRQLKQFKGLHWQTPPCGSFDRKGFPAHWQTG